MFCQTGVNGIDGMVVHETTDGTVVPIGVPFTSSGEVGDGCGPKVAIGRVGCCKMLTVGSGSVGTGVGLGTFGIVAVGVGVSVSIMVASALPGVANRSATTNGSCVVVSFP